ncbi:MAG: hypothetical protein COB22_02395 [Cycloclasticus sp.]|nr:MAG: hypothetical protein COB22_02395 [Cycloclasticus sp.]
MEKAKGLKMENKIKETPQATDCESRREFLRKSKYAVYATPAITSLILHSESAMASHKNCPTSSPGHPNC